MNIKKLIPVGLAVVALTVAGVATQANAATSAPTFRAGLCSTAHLKGSIAEDNGGGAAGSGARAWKMRDTVEPSSSTGCVHTACSQRCFASTTRAPYSESQPGRWRSKVKLRNGTSLTFSLAPHEAPPGAHAAATSAPCPSRLSSQVT